MLIVHRTTVRTNLFPSDFKFFFFQNFPGQPSVGRFLLHLQMGNSSRKWGIFQRSYVCGSKKIPRGKPSSPIFAPFARIWFQHPKFLFQRASPYSGETAKKILLKDNLGSVSVMFGFVSIVMKKIMPVIEVVFSLNHGILATESVLESSVPRGKKLGPLNAHPQQNFAFAPLSRFFKKAVLTLICIVA